MIVLDNHVAIMYIVKVFLTTLVKSISIHNCLSVTNILPICFFRSKLQSTQEHHTSAVRFARLSQFAANSVFQSVRW